MVHVSILLNYQNVTYIEKNERKEQEMFSVFKK